MTHSKEGTFFPPDADGIIGYVGTDNLPCPICGGELIFRGTCLRWVKWIDAIKHFRLRVLECKDCGRTHRELPDFIIPYKRYALEFIAEIASASAEDHLNYIETSTWQRIKAWVDWFLQYAWNILEGLKIEFGARISDASKRVGNTLADQLSYFVRVVVNSGNWFSIVR